MSIPSSSLATIKFTKSMARAAMYVGLNAVNTVFNNNDLKKIYIYIKAIKNETNELKIFKIYIYPFSCFLQRDKISSRRLSGDVATKTCTIQSNAGK